MHRCMTWNLSLSDVKLFHSHSKRKYASGSRRVGTCIVDNVGDSSFTDRSVCSLHYTSRAKPHFCMRVAVAFLARSASFVLCYLMTSTRFPPLQWIPTLTLFETGLPSSHVGGVLKINWSMLHLYHYRGTVTMMMMGVDHKQSVTRQQSLPCPMQVKRINSLMVVSRWLRFLKSVTTGIRYHGRSH